MWKLALVGVLLHAVIINTKETGTSLEWSDDTQNTPLGYNLLLAVLQHFFVPEDNENVNTAPASSPPSGNIFKHYFYPPTPSPVTVIKHYWFPPTEPTQESLEGGSGEAFETRVLIELVGRPSDVTKQGRQILQEAFFDIYTHYLINARMSILKTSRFCLILPLSRLRVET